jgi:tetratricopeptide (TPR) repeat protein
MVIARVLTGFTVSLLVAAAVRAHDHGAEPMPANTRLGHVSFQNSCARKVQPEFNRAVALLHSFWLDEAARTFRRVQTADPQCAMAWWGEAFAGMHFMLGEPSPQEVAASAALLTQARTGKRRTERETAWLDALQAFLDDYAPPRYLDNARRFSDAMAALAARHPGDLEAQVFAAQSLLTWRAPADTTLANAHAAVDILAPLMREHPDHPGIAHYIIHATDNPSMATLGLDAARRYASIAPAAPHALHMPSHIFTRLGLWSDDIRSNLASKAAAEDQRARAGAENRLHAMEFLVYAYLQTGQYARAAAVAAQGRAVPAAEVTPAFSGYYPLVMARFDFLLAIDAQDWERARTLQPVADGNAYVQGLALLAHAMAAGQRHDADAALDAVARHARLLAREPRATPGSPFVAMHDQIAAWASFAAGNRDAAIARLRPIADLQERQGKGEVDLPVREMIAQMLLLDEQWAAAFEEFSASLRTDPNRFTALLGAASAAEKLGRQADAVRLYRQLLDSCAEADDAGRRRLEHARAFVAAAPS